MIVHCSVISPGENKHFVVNLKTHLNFSMHYNYYLSSRRHSATSPFCPLHIFHEGYKIHFGPRYLTPFVYQ